MSSKYCYKSLKELKISVENKSIVEQLRYLSEKFKEKIAFSTSFGQEDQVVTDLVFSNNIDIKVFTLDTGRLFNETYKVFSKTLEKYEKNIEVYFPGSEDVEKLLTEKGPFSFYQSVENRKECCHIRKVKPLRRALEGIECWITGLRAEQSGSRNDINILQWNDSFNLIKYNPLINWNLNDVVNYIRDNNIIYNTLHDKGYISIGCEPCTRPIRNGEDIRAGRWWWERRSTKECGLHIQNNTE